MRQGDEQFGIGVLAEVFYLYVSGGVVKHVSGADALLRYVGARQGERSRFLLAVAYDAYLDLCVFRPFQSAHGFFVSYYFADEGLAVNAYYLVTGAYAGLVGRAVLYHALHVYGVFPDDELNAYA